MTLPIMHSQTSHQVERLLSSPSHALGLTGEQGAGKGHIAYYIASQILNSDPSDHPYVKHIDVVTQKTGIEDIRELQKFLSLTVPGKDIYKRVVIVEHIDSIGHEAQNALLKTLEEPPQDTIIIVTFARDTAILPTIHSRLQKINVLPVSQTTAQTALRQYSQQELTKAFYISNGQVGLLMALLNDQTDHPLLQGITQAREVITMSRYQRLASVDKLTKGSVPPLHILDGLYRLMNASYQQSLKTKSNDELRAIVSRLNLIEQAISDLDSNVQAKLVLSRLFLEL